MLRQSSSVARDRRNLEMPPHLGVGVKSLQQDRRRTTIGWEEEARRELFPEIWGGVLSVIGVVLARIVEWVLAAPRTEGLLGDFMVVTVLGVEVPQEVAEEAIGEGER